MASFRKRRGVWYARVQWYEVGTTRQTEKLIALRTSSKVTAKKRMAEVKNKGKDFVGCKILYQNIRGYVG